MKFTRIILIIFFFSFSFLTKGQTSESAKNDFEFKAKLNFVDKDTLSHGKIILKKNGKRFKTLKLNGLYQPINLELNNTYLFICKRRGYYTKRVMVDTHIPTGREKEEFARFLMTVELHPKELGKQINTKQLIGKVLYSIDVGDFDFEKYNIGY